MREEGRDEMRRRWRKAKSERSGTRSIERRIVVVGVV
jgi:hypothetical protein